MNNIMGKIVLTFFLLISLFSLSTRIVQAVGTTDCCGGPSNKQCPSDKQCVSPASNVCGPAGFTGNCQARANTGSTGDFDSIVGDLKNPDGFKYNDLGQVVSTFLTYAFTIAGLALLVYFIWGGFTLFTSGGDQKKVAEGKSTITNAIVGFVIVFVAFWIVQLVGSLLGLQTSIGTLFGN